jgi:hypothetical protein
MAFGAGAAAAKGGGGGWGDAAKSFGQGMSKWGDTIAGQSSSQGPATSVDRSMSTEQGPSKYTGFDPYAQHPEMQSAKDYYYNKRPLDKSDYEQAFGREFSDDEFDRFQTSAKFGKVGKEAKATYDRLNEWEANREHTQTFDAKTAPPPQVSMGYDQSKMSGFEDKPHAVSGSRPQLDSWQSMGYQQAPSKQPPWAEQASGQMDQVQAKAMAPYQGKGPAPSSLGMGGGSATGSVTGGPVPDNGQHYAKGEGQKSMAQLQGIEGQYAPVLGGSTAPASSYEKMQHAQKAGQMGLAPKKDFYAQPVGGKVIEMGAATAAPQHLGGSSAPADPMEKSMHAAWAQQDGLAPSKNYMDLGGDASGGPSTGNQQQAHAARAQAMGFAPPPGFQSWDHYWAVNK